MLTELWKRMPGGLQNALKRAYVERERKRIEDGWMSHLRVAAEAVSADCLRTVRNLEDWKAHRPEVRRQVLWMLGLDRERERGPLAARVVSVADRGRYSVENVVFESLPGLFVTANFYRPLGVAGPAPCVLYLCGHQIHPQGAKTRYQDRFLWYPEHGFACLVVDPIQCGEIQGIHHGLRSHGFWEWLSLGYTPAGVEVWNGMRALDWLQTREEVDRNRLGVTGTSGGGVISWFLAALDERIRVVAPSASTYTIGTQVARDLVSSQCDCTFYPNVFGLDFPAVASLVAPRPLLVVAGVADRIFPPEGYRPAFEMVSRIYGLYGRSTGEPERLRLAEWNRGHTESERSIQEIRRWMCEWIGSVGPIEESAITERSAEGAPGSSLVCFSEPPANARNLSIHRDFLQVPSRSKVGSRSSWEERREELLEHLRAEVFRWFPGEATPFIAKRRRGSGGHAQRFARYSEWTIDSEPGSRVELQLYQPAAENAGAGVVVVVRRREEGLGFPDDEILPLLARQTVVVIAPRFSRWQATAESFSRVQRAAALAGRSFDSMAVWDVVRTVRWALSSVSPEPGPVSVFGRGCAGIVGLYAALFEQAIGHVILDAPPSSHRDGPVFPAILRFGDLPEFAAALAPRRLTFLGEPPSAFEFTSRIYELLAPGRFAAASSLFQAQTAPLKGERSHLQDQTSDSR